MKTHLLSLGVTMVLATSSIASTSITSNTQSSPTVHDHEGNVYRTVEIGDQVWLAENLRTTQFQDGSKINSAAIPDDDETNLHTYGRLYDWHDVSDPRNICPKGWRVASDEDWKKLERTLGIAEEEIDTEGWRGDDDIAIQLKKAQPDTLFKKFDQSLVNKYQFSATPAGVKWHGLYITQGAYTEFWTADPASDSKAYIRTLAYSWWNAHKGQIRRATSSKEYMFSVRCVKI
ncbi:fibrobacter succinogenes major paralogous domain-containing protein [Vibrio sp. SCSIO 43136]|uniref:fibrobacter succinogenes major paralogous domain-containing protein n=1 Tax=Vibrio sp. SCSIO 43136 TaxID=2819101 RepID=UPI002075E07A|nr:fibrobacter succinogenes major paralogous domain-containing protein [Vibrio sp. SCSIO 43136]USD67443.1 fibrobacter succinogenes major paralogous domain-containing protein [Vibrio sp. SCSIO 43136]